MCVSIIKITSEFMVFGQILNIYFFLIIIIFLRIFVTTIHKSHLTTILNQILTNISS